MSGDDIRGDGDIKTVAVEVAKDADIWGISWCRRSDARSVFGLGKDILDQWVRDGKVEAHKLFPGKNGTVVFSAPDISRAIKDAPRFYPKKV